MDTWDTLTIVFGVCGISLIVGWAVRAWMEDRRILHVFRAQSNQLGLDVEKFHIFTHGPFSPWKRPVLTPIKRGTGDAPDLAVFRFRCQIPGGKRRTEVSLTIVYMHCPANRLPDFAIQPETHWLLSDVSDPYFRTRDIEIKSHPDFSRLYLLRGRDETAIRQAFNADVLEFFEAHPGLSIEAVDNQMIYFRRNTTVLPNEVSDLVNEARELLSCFGVSSSPDR